MSHFKSLLVLGTWGWAIAICILSLIPPVDTGIQTFSHIDKVQHLVAYGVAMLLFGLLYPIQYKWSVIGLLLMGLSLELLQNLTSTRHMDGLDMIANTLGVLIGWFISHWIKKKLQPFME